MKALSTEINAAPSGAEVSTADDMAVVMERFVEVSRDLELRYAALDERARRVEEELARANAELIAERNESEQLHRRLAAVDKMAAVGTLAAGIAHEIRNPLNAIQGFASLLSKRLAGDAELERWASAIVSGSEETESIISGLLHFARPGELALETLDTEQLLRSVVELTSADGSHLDAERIEIDCRVHSIAGDRIKLRQALRNLLQNAVDAQVDDGDRKEGLLARLVAERDGDEVVLRVQDAGPGVADELRARVLEPFFTTRAEGTGLGLALVHVIAELHGGRLEVRDQPSPLGGAEFCIHLPILPTQRPATHS